MMVVVDLQQERNVRAEDPGIVADVLNAIENTNKNEIARDHDGDNHGADQYIFQDRELFHTCPTRAL